jgi:hypothetical protein
VIKKKDEKTEIYQPSDAWVTIKMEKTTKVVAASSRGAHGAVLLFSMFLP